jgi:hypothetical protein
MEAEAVAQMILRTKSVFTAAMEFVRTYAVLLHFGSL